MAEEEEELGLKGRDFVLTGGKISSLAYIYWLQTAYSDLGNNWIESMR